jgi:oligo-1,6-glucosidase
MINAPFVTVEDLLDIQAVNFAKEALARGEPVEDLLAGIAAGSRDNARTPMQWDDSAHAGFTTGTPWIPVNPNFTEINAAAATADPDSVFHYYRRLIALRHEHPVIALGDFRMLLEGDPQVYAFTRSLEGVTLLVLGNFSGDEVSADLPDAADWAASDLLIGNYPASKDSGRMVLRPWETRVYRRDA